MAVVRERADVGNISGDHTQMMPKAPDAKILPAKSLEECRRESVVVRAQRATRRGVNIRTGCDGNGHCAYDHTNNKARCFCNTGKGGAGCTEDIVEQNAISGTMTGLLVTVIILVVGLGGVLSFLIWKVREARGNTSTYMKVEGTEMMLSSQI